MNNEELDAGLAETPGYRYADVVGNHLFVAGQVPQDQTGAIVGIGDPAIQARLCLDHLKTVIGVHGFTVDDVRQMVVYVVGEQSNLTDAWRAVTEWFDESVPPATLLGVNRLGYPDQLVEIDATVIRS